MIVKFLNLLAILQLAHMCATHPTTHAAVNPRWSWSSCGKASHALQISSLEVSPSPPEPGKPVTMRVVGEVMEKINEGAYGNLTVKLGAIPILFERHDLCDDARKEDLGISCPLDPGTHTVTKTFSLPMELPAAKYTVSFEGYTNEDTDLVCLNMFADFSKAS